MKKLLLALFLAFTMCLSLAGCGEKSLLDAKEPVELSFWHVYGEQAGSPMDLLVDEFNRTVGKERGVRVRVTAQSSASRIGDLLMESQNDTVSYADGTSEPMNPHALPIPMTLGSVPLRARTWKPSLRRRGTSSARSDKHSSRG